MYCYYRGDYVVAGAYAGRFRTTGWEDPFYTDCSGESYTCNYWYMQACYDGTEKVYTYEGGLSPTGILVLLLIFTPMAFALICVVTPQMIRAPVCKFICPCWSWW